MVDQDPDKLPAADPPSDEPPQTDPPAPENGSVGDLPEWARKELDKVRREAAAYRVKARELEPLAARARELEDAGKTELERLTGDRDSHKSRADAAESLALRLQVALDAAPEHATMTQIRAVAKRLTGATAEDLEADAAELFGLLAPEPPGGVPPVPGRPTERMTPRGGSDPDEPLEDTDPEKLAARVPRAR